MNYSDYSWTLHTSSAIRKWSCVLYFANTEVKSVSKNQFFILSWIFLIRCECSKYSWAFEDVLLFDRKVRKSCLTEICILNVPDFALHAARLCCKKIKITTNGIWQRLRGTEYVGKQKLEINVFENIQLWLYSVKLAVTFKSQLGLCNLGHSLHNFLLVTCDRFRNCLNSSCKYSNLWLSSSHLTHRIE